MPKIHEMIESKYLKKEDIDGEALVTIIKIGQVNVAMEDKPAEMKWAARFEEMKKPMVLNSTNLQLIAKALGSDDSDDWVGKQVLLYVDDNVSFGGKIVGGIRVKANKVAAAAPKKPAAVTGGKFDDMEDDIPF